MISVRRWAVKVLVMQPPHPDDRIPDLLTVGEVARRLSLHPNTVRQRAATRRLLAKRLDGGKGELVFLKSHIEWEAEKAAREREREREPEQ